MDTSEPALSDSRKMESVDAVTDAGCFNQSTHTRYANNDADVEAFMTVETDGVGPSNATRVDGDQQTPRDLNLYYDMTGQKYLIVFNHYQYTKWRMKKFSRPSTRSGTNNDKRSLEDTFRNRGFHVEPHDDCTHEEIKKYLSDMCAKDHSNTSCVAVAVMTHGIDTYLCAADILYPLTDITEPLQAVASLIKKPKLFFIQACRELHIRDPDSSNKKTTELPMGPDCLFLYSTYLDYVSFRCPYEGAWMIQSLCKVINDNHVSMNLAQMVTLVNNMIAKKDALFLRNAGTSLERKEYLKQIPVTDSKLEKYLML